MRNSRPLLLSNQRVVHLTSLDLGSLLWSSLMYLSLVLLCSSCVLGHLHPDLFDLIGELGSPLLILLR